MLSIQRFVFNSFEVNSYLVFNNEGGTVLFDAAGSNQQEFDLLDKYLVRNKLNLLAIINTHAHVDHLPGLHYLCKKYEVPFYINKEDEFLLQQAEIQGLAFGFDIDKVPVPGGYLSEGDVVEIGSEKMDILHVPGHSPGSLVFVSKESGFLISGDVLFYGSIGRTDLPGGDHDVLIKGIREKLLVLDDSMKVYPGHGPATTIGQEKRINAFLQ